MLFRSHMDIYFYRLSVRSWWWTDDDKHVNAWICNCVDDLCMKIILDRFLCFLCLALSFIVDTCVLKFIILEKSFRYCTCIKLWGILWNCISSASRIWFYLGVYIELRPVTRAYIMFTVSKYKYVKHSLNDSNVIVYGQKLNY